MHHTGSVGKNAAQSWSVRCLPTQQTGDRNCLNGRFGETMLCRNACACGDQNTPICGLSDHGGMAQALRPGCSADHCLDEDRIGPKRAPDPGARCADQAPHLLSLQTTPAGAAASCDRTKCVAKSTRSSSAHAGSETRGMRLDNAPRMRSLFQALCVSQGLNATAVAGLSALQCIEQTGGVAQITRQRLVGLVSRVRATSPNFVVRRALWAMDSICRRSRALPFGLRSVMFAMDAIHPFARRSPTSRGL